MVSQDHNEYNNNEEDSSVLLWYDLALVKRWHVSFLICEP